METLKLKRFAQFARRSLIEQVSTKLKLILSENSSARRERPETIKKLEETIQNSDKEQIIERVAYIWFNRFCALRFMDVNRFNRVNIVSPSDPGQFQPEILAEAKMGHIDDEMVSEKIRQQITSLLNGDTPSHDPQGEAYRLLVVAACNFWNTAMPFLFEKIEDYTELLMPEDLLSGNSILAYTREAMTPEACEDVEVIGWLYQFYISEKKDEVFDGLKKNKKITPENIPAATQLFTPHWIVRYLVENSLGRLWLLNRPQSHIFKNMKERGEDCYFIEPVKPDTDFLKISKPEEIKICDPACGSGHMLTYAFDLLYAIYEEEGYESAEIPEKILTHNLYGIEIDERAGELAAFALTMKARAKQRRFFNKSIKPNICVLENVSFSSEVIDDYIKSFGTNIFTSEIVETLHQFDEADNFGSLIRPIATSVKTVLATLGQLQARINEKIGSQEELPDDQKLMLSTPNFKKILQALRQADYLCPKYHVVVANPPYMGSGSMNAALKKFASALYPEAKNDLYSMFIHRCIGLPIKGGFMSMIAMHSWMFLSRFERLRFWILKNNAIVTLAHLGAQAFDSIGGEVVSTAAFVLKSSVLPDYSATYFRLIGYPDSKSKDQALLNRSNAFEASAKEILDVPGTPLSYWLSSAFRTHFVDSETLASKVETAVGLFTCNNDRFLRNWHEVGIKKIGFDCADRIEAENSAQKYFPIQKGGGYRRWYGLNYLIVQFNDDGKEIRDYRKESGQSWSLPGVDFYFRAGITWSGLTTDANSFRWCDKGCIFESNKGQMLFSKSPLRFLGYMNSVVCAEYIACINPTLSVQSNEIKRLPFVESLQINQGEVIVKDLVEIGRVDWDFSETSWDFTSLPLLNPDYHQPSLKATYQKLHAHWREMTLEMQRLEQENNRIFIDAYGLQDELTPEVPLKEITLTCNPHYRYGNNKSEDELEALLLADTMRELVSYAVGCMFGRYSLDKPGLILANQGETIDDYLKRVPEPSFSADDDNVIPMLDGDWFTDDITERFHKFLRVAFGDDYYEENLSFVEEGLGKDIRKYFLKDFYSDHVKRYKKRPIYWMFSSPKGSFNALIYMHRYRPDTASVVLTDYLRDFIEKLSAHKKHLEAVSINTRASKGEKAKALKEIEKINKTISELEEYERDVLYPLATAQVEIDLDDGVKVNYPKLGKALKKITGLS
ncbi:BREX-1 system adenine-specific DNA-methyltransferase PglX [Oceanispirochaeta sp. M1]|uniref:BREX-1 system adenine-specific DNA-methyltransferase PglX n=2 Tax=Oceanispirochaeta TaxID=2035349 RepID=UPI000E09A975|nr:BREX-1 system adenine-specific DNA-methyltransferase PglX [Oceanispirochaeta sp. M1]MBF9015174.1 BREX-1 system adenine-specific DNA-methyltransferase PglX [Oceanispirochaeta sp. M2]NPD71632.1 BREX-1 system adenine-specific DNA-methyltransferase PglX [Oceanispirochaeta sp. M1]RDG33199.1 BREX-1 system adenine-specific DNA-methyltransferase PglX [Oceanispirochaeta sp. M1]